MVNDRPYEQIAVGEKASFSKTITEADIVGFAGITGDFNPIHVDQAFAEKSMFKGRIAHGMLAGAFISTVLGTALPGKNTVFMSQEMKFVAPAYIGDTLAATVEVTNKRDDKRILELKTTVSNQKGKEVVVGKAKVMKLKD